MFKIIEGDFKNNKYSNEEYLDNWPMLYILENGKKFTENYKVKHNVDAMYGWYRYSSRFALPVFGEDGEIIRYNVFNVVMVIRHARDGKKYLYDIINIKKETSTLFQSEDITQ